MAWWVWLICKLSCLSLLVMFIYQWSIVLILHEIIVLFCLYNLNNTIYTTILQNSQYVGLTFDFIIYTITHSFEYLAKSIFNSPNDNRKVIWFIKWSISSVLLKDFTSVNCTIFKKNVGINIRTILGILINYILG